MLATLIQLGAFVGLWAFLYGILYLQVIKPLAAMRFYRSQGISCEFVPLTGSNPTDSDNVRSHGDYYHGWLQKLLGSTARPRTSVPTKPRLFCKNIGSACALVLSDPQLVKEMFINKDEFIKHPFQNALVKRLSPNGLVLIENALWKKHRKFISKGFEYERIDSLLGQVHSISKRLMEKLAEAPAMENVFNCFKTAAGNIISLVYFQEDIASLLIEGKPMPVFLSDLISNLSNESYNWKYCIFGMNIVDLGLFAQHRKLLKDIKIMRGVVRDILLKHVAIRKAGLQPKQFSMWDVFLDETNTQQPFSEDEIIDEFITFFSDGVYTTGHFMMMMTYHLAKHPQWKQKLREELKQNLSFVEQPTQALINGLPILQACTKQTLRLAPPVVTGIERICVRDTSFSDGTKVKKDTLMMACHLANHLDPSLHTDPTVFNPNRWLQADSKTLESFQKYPGSYIPFSIGERQCPGQKFAMAQAAIYFSQLLLHYDYEIKDQSSYSLRFTQRFLREPLQPFSYTLTKL